MNNFIPISQPYVSREERLIVEEVMKSGWISSLGVYINKFEEDFARFCGVKHALCTSNGTVAIHLALHALGIGPNDEVIVPDITFVATGMGSGGRDNFLILSVIEGAVKIFFVPIN